ncbi:MAG: DUF4276 family protein [Deltaproteobacteria bacterium]|nr:DUF4276 family protein [Deltaproteobacteria bacterium]
MLCFGIVVEGFYDEQAIKTFISRLFPEDVYFMVRNTQGRSHLNRKFTGYLDEFKHKNVDKAIVIRDQDNKCVKELIETLKSRISGRQYPFEIIFHIIENELESWLLADENAIRKVIKRSVPRMKMNLETLHDPKNHLSRIFSEANMNYTGTKAGEIALKANLNTIASRCPGFKRFRESVLDC